MRKLVLVTLITLLGNFFILPPGRAAEAGILIVKVREAAPVEQLAALAHERELLFDNTYRLKVSDKEAAMNYLEAVSWVEFVEEDQRLTLETTVSDPLFVLDDKEASKQWYLPKMRVHEAWDITQGAAVPVAIVDTGINARHEDLNDGRVIKGFLSYCQVPSLIIPNECLLRISGEVAAGVNSDDNGHGTIVAGLIGAIANNNKGIAGINWNVRLMPIKTLDSTGSGFASDVASGIRWAADNGARIINLSIGGPGLEGIGVLEDAIVYAFNKGILVVAAVGNDAAITGGNLNTNPVLPVCADGGKNMIVGVAAVDVADQKARFSNYGSNCVDISAPGTTTFIDKQNKQGIVSTYYDPTRPGENSLYVYAIGTSVAAPLVSGVAGLMLSAFPDLDIKAIRDRLIASVDNIDDKNSSGCNGSSCVGQIGRGRLNALNAVRSVVTFSSGTLVKSPEGQTFLIERGLKRPISDFVFRQRFAGTVLTAATAGQLDSFPLGSAVPPADGTLIKEPADPTVYLVEGGERRPLSLVAFISRGLRFGSVVELSAEEVAAYPRGSNAPVVDGVLLKTASHPAVYLFETGERHLLSYFVFLQRNFQNLEIAIIADTELSNYPPNPRGFLYPPLEGTLLRGSFSPTVYLVQEKKLRGLNLAAFQNRGLRFEDVRVVPQSELEGYEIGEALIE